MGMFQTSWALWFKKKKKKIQVKTVATFLAIKQTLEILGHSGNKKLNTGSRK